MSGLDLSPPQRAHLIAALSSMYEGARNSFWHEAETITEILLGYPYADRMTPDEFRERLGELL